MFFVHFLFPSSALYMDMASLRWSSIRWVAMCFISVAASLSDILLPLPDGPFGTSISFLQLTDNTRNDSFAPTPQARQLMISIFQPVPAVNCTSLLVDYMPNATASFVAAEWSTQMRLPLSALPLGNLKLQACSPLPPPLLPSPLVLFSPALGTTRLLYSALAQQVASQGYTVVTLDHPYDADIVTFLDLSILLRNASPGRRGTCAISLCSCEPYGVLNVLQVFLLIVHYEM